MGFGAKQNPLTELGHDLHKVHVSYLQFELEVLRNREAGSDRRGIMASASCGVKAAGNLKCKS